MIKAIFIDKLGGLRMADLEHPAYKINFAVNVGKQIYYDTLELDDKAEMLYPPNNHREFLCIGIIKQYYIYEEQ